MAASDRCPTCDVDLEDTGTSIRCWRCGWEVRDADNGQEYYDRGQAIADRDAFIANSRR
jgi:tRNA(Ile2) C34 agmatinyltransferase TiaS